MKAYGKIGANKHGWIEREKPVCGKDDAIIKPLILAVCTSDIHIVEGPDPGYDTIMGHEGIGEITEVGENVTDFKVGDKVIIPATTPIWNTKETRQGVSMHSGGLCGGCTLGSARDGLMAEYALINDADMNLALLPDDIDPLAASMIGDMISTGLSGSELGDVQFGDTIAVLGCGPVGLMGIAGARLKGAGRIIAVDCHQNRFDVAKEYGATDFVNFETQDVVETVMELTGGRGVDVCIVANWSDETFEEGLAITRLGGHLSNINTFTHQETLTFNTLSWGFGLGNKIITGGLCPGGRDRMEQMIPLLRYGRLDPTKFITHIYNGFDKMDEAFSIMVSKEDGCIKSVVVCDEDLYNQIMESRK